MRVSEIMTSNVKTCSEADSLACAAQVMWDRDCGIVPVIGEDNRLIGVVTDRDALMCAYFDGRPLAEIGVGKAMSRVVQVCHPDETVEEAEARMRDVQVRRLPVVDTFGRLIGMLSLNDVARSSEVSRDDVARTLAGIGQPHGRRVAALQPDLRM